MSGSTQQLIFSDLFVYDGHSLGYVRAYLDADGQGIALVIDPEDNPGRSAVNAAESLVAALRRAFVGAATLRVFAWFARTSLERQWFELAVRDGMGFPRVEHQIVEELVGETINLPPDEEGRCRDLVGGDHPLLALVPPPEPERSPLGDLVVVAVADIPWPHNPAGCTRHTRFEEIRALYPQSGHPPPAAGAQWFLSLGEADFAACEYHQADWCRIAEVSVDVLRELEPDGDLDDVLAAVNSRLEDPIETRWCVSLFGHPIAWNPGQDSVVNGQHRSCALRASGAIWCVADLCGGFAEDQEPGDPRARAAADIASFWAQRAGRGGTIAGYSSST
jgi:hypothetical protein